MSSATNSEFYNPPKKELVIELCKYLLKETGIESGERTRILNKCFSIITSQDASYFNSSLSDNDEFAIVEKIKKHLKSTGQNQDALQEFDTLHRKLIKISQKVLENRSAILSLLLRLGETSLNGNIEVGQNITKRSFDSLNISSDSSSSISNRSRAGADISKMSVTRGSQGLISSSRNVVDNSNSHWSNSLPKENSYSVNVNTERRSSHRSDKSERPEMITRSIPPTPPHSLRTGKYEVSETQIVQELLYCFQGIEGNILRSDGDNGFIIDSLAYVRQPQLVKGLMELGYMHNCVLSLSQELEKGGAVARGLTCAIRTELTDYYRKVAQLNSDLKLGLSLVEDSPMSEEASSHSGLSLHRLRTWVREPLWHFQVIADICRVCVSRRGGAVVSAAFAFSYHGDLRAQAIATKILASATRPLFTLMCHWIIHGELYDPHDEFFVAINKRCSSHNRWKDKFFLRKDLVPAVMSEKQAMMVLNAGKCINFLNDICKQKIAVTGAREKLRQLENAQGGELLQLAEPASPLAIVIESAFMEASRLVLDTLKSQFKLYENFQGLRRYMLMGQGDFYGYLIQLLEPELNKNREQIYTHNLLSILETALRATNAQFEDKEILPRVSLELLEPSLGETGWEAFNMVFTTSDPLNTVFQLGDGSYKMMFHFLWSLKRVEFCMSNFRKEQTCMLKKLQRRTDFKELQRLLNYTSLLTAEMVHYIIQVQYYILFEVIECAFESFMKKFANATTIEEVIRDHELFIQEIKTKTLKDGSEDSRVMLTLMQGLNLNMLSLLSYGSQFLVEVETELERRWRREQKILEQGTCYMEEQQHNQLVKQFNTQVMLAAQEIKHNCKSYQSNVRQLLVQLSAQQNELQLLSSRLDFNEYYKRSEPELSENFKFRRVSNFVGVTVRE